MGPRAGLENLAPTTGIRSPDRPTRSESQYRLSYAGPRSFWMIVNLKKSAWRGVDMAEFNCTVPAYVP